MKENDKSEEIVEVKIDPMLPMFVRSFEALEKLSEIVDSWLPKEDHDDRA